MFYSVVVMHIRSGQIKKVWIRDEKQVNAFIAEDCVVYRTGTDQIALEHEMGGVTWMDVKEEKENGEE